MKLTRLVSVLLMVLVLLAVLTTAGSARPCPFSQVNEWGDVVCCCPTQNGGTCCAVQPFCGGIILGCFCAQ